MLMSDTVRGIFPNTFSKEKFVSVMNKIKSYHDFEDDLYHVFDKVGGSIEYPCDMEDTLVKTLEMMFMDDTGIISDFIYDYGFCLADGIQIEITETNADGTQYEFKICNSEDLYDYLVKDMICKFEAERNKSKCADAKPEDGDHNQEQYTDDFVKIYNTVYKDNKEGSGE